MQILYSKFAKYFDAISVASLVDTKKEVAFLQKLFDEHKIHSVLDIACGTGRHSVGYQKQVITSSVLITPASC